MGDHNSGPEEAARGVGERAAAEAKEVIQKAGQ